jgi:PTH1 family peptidyl-tRNA hydrolase
VFLIVGLGNPGAEYTATRHNVGFLVVDSLARRIAVAVDRGPHGAHQGKGRIGSTPVLLAKPMTYMNLSGGPTRAICDFFKVGTDKVIVVHDDVDLAFGSVRVKLGGGHGGHNGLRDLNKHLGADYARVRVGISRPPPGWDTADYVLGRWTPDEAAHLDDIVSAAVDAVERVVLDGAERAMNHFNTREPDKTRPSDSARQPQRAERVS